MYINIIYSVEIINTVYHMLTIHLKIYQNVFESRYLEDIFAHYRRQVILLKYLNLDQYIRKVSLLISSFIQLFLTVRLLLIGVNNN